MLTAFQPPRGRGFFDRGIQSNLSPASPECLAGAFPQRRNHRAFGVIAASESRGREGRAACAKRRAGRRGHFSRPYRGPFLCGEPSSLPRSILDQSSCVLPVSGRVLPENVPRRFGSLASQSLCRVVHAARLCPRSVSAGQAIEIVLPPFRRRVSHAGRDGRHMMNAWQRLDI